MRQNKRDTRHGFGDVFLYILSILFGAFRWPRRRQRPVLIAVSLMLATTFLAGCGSLQVEAGFRQPAELTATAIARTAPTPIQKPQLGKLALVKGGDIWVKDLPGGEAKRLTQDGHSSEPRWSSSGQWLAFRKEYQVIILRADGTDATTLNAGAAAARFAWSPVEDLLAYTTGGGSLRVVKPGTAGEKELVSLKVARQGTGVNGITWSPDGQWIALEWVELSGDSSQFVQEIRRIRVDGSESQVGHVNRGAERHYLAGWSPDEQWLLAWHGSNSESLRADGFPLEALPLTGGQPVRLSGGMLTHQDFLSWSPDGQRLAFVDGGYRGTWENKAITIATLAGSLHRISDAGRADLFPAWSPEGQQIAFTGSPAFPNDGGTPDTRSLLSPRRIWVMQPDGTGKRQLTNDPKFRDERPQWSANGDYLLFARLQEDQAHLWLMRSDGSDLKQVVDELTPSPGITGYYGYLDWGRLYDWWPGPPSARKQTPVAVAAPTRPMPTLTVTATPTGANVGGEGLGSEVRRVARLPAPSIGSPDERRWSLGWSPKSQALAYTSKEGVLVVRAPDFIPVRIAAATGSTPLWSPDGRFVAFAGGRKEGDLSVGTLWLASADGSAVRDLLPGDKAKLSVSTAKLLVDRVDERTLSFTEHMGSGTDALATVDLVSGEVKFIAAHPQAEFPKVGGTFYAWSPDKKLVADGDWGRGLPTTTLLDLSRRTATPLDSGQAGQRFQQFRSWAPDGKSFVYAQWAAQGEKAWPVVDQAPDLYLWDVARGKGEVLVPRAYQARWSPEGKRIAFLLLGRYSTDGQGRITSTDFQPGQPSELYLGIHDVAAQKPTTLIRVARSLKFDNPSEAIRWFETRAPVWSPGGASLAYWDEARDLWVVAADGSVRRQVTKGVAVQAVSWSADGKLLALQLLEEVWLLQPFQG